MSDGNTIHRASETIALIDTLDQASHRPCHVRRLEASCIGIPCNRAIDGDVALVGAQRLDSPDGSLIPADDRDIIEAWSEHS